MHVYLCNTCFFALRVLEGELSGGQLVGPLSDTWGKALECPSCGASTMFGHPERAIAPDLMVKLRIRDLEPTECFLALTGSGLPEEHLATASVVREALLRSPIKECVLLDLRGTQRSVLEKLVLEDGTRIYLGASPQGATVYRLARRENL